MEEVFGAVGYRLFGGEWSGNEIWASPIEPPETIESRRQPIIDQITEKDGLEKTLRAKISKSTNPTRIKRLEIDLMALVADRAGLISQANNAPAPDGRYRESYECYARRERAEQELIGALAKGSIVANCLDGMNVPDNFWSGRWGFRYYLDLGIVVLPRDYAGRRRASVIFDEVATERWIETVMPLDVGRLTELSPKTRCELFLREAVKLGPQIKSKIELRKEARESIPGLSERAFNGAWDRVVPESWRRPGRRAW